MKIKLTHFFDVYIYNIYHQSKNNILADKLLEIDFPRNFVITGDFNSFVDLSLNTASSDAPMHSNLQPISDLINKKTSLTLFAS